MNPASEVKARYSVLELYQRFYPDLASSRRGRTGKCPFHDDSSPSMLIDEEGFRCMGCGRYGSVIDFVAYARNIDTREAIKFLMEGINLSVPAPVKKEPAPRKQTGMKRPWVVEKAQEMLEVSDSYFIDRRGLSIEVARKHRLGAYWQRWTCQTSNKTHHLSALRYVIPYYRQGRLVAWNARLDEEKAMSVIRSLPREDLEDILMEYGYRGDSKLIREVFGPKYFKDGPPIMFNADAVYRDGPLEVPYCLLVEGEIDCLTLESEGYTAIAAKYTHSTKMHIALQKVGLVYIIRDPDEGGERIAVETQNYLKKNGIQALILTPPWGSDVNSGPRGELKRWLRAAGVISWKKGEFII